jgi:hypothetical protein
MSDFIVGCFSHDISKILKTKNYFIAYNNISSEGINAEEFKYFQSEQDIILLRNHKKPAFRPIHYENNRYVLLLSGFNLFLSNNKRIESLDEGDIQYIIESIKNSDGEYLCIIFNKNDRSLHIINDRFGSRPFFYIKISNDIYYSTNYSFLVNLNKEHVQIDPKGWLQLASFCHTLEEQTIFSDIKRLQPSSELTIRNGTISKIKYWTLSYNINNELQPKQFAKSVFQAFTNGALSRTRNKKGFIALSGGLDSRLVAAVMNRNDFFAYTFIDSISTQKTNELIAASLVAQRLNYRHHIDKIEINQLSKNSKELATLTGCLTLLHHPMKTMEYIKMMIQTDRFQVGGGPGDVLAGGYITKNEYIYPEDQENKIYEYCSNRAIKIDYLRLIFSKEVIDEYHTQVFESILESFDNIKAPTAAHKITAWAMTVRQPAFTFNSPIHNHICVTEMNPHLGYAYVDLMLQLSAELLFNKQFYSYMIYHSVPEIQDVIYANTGKTLDGILNDVGYNINFIDGVREYYHHAKKSVKDIIYWDNIKTILINKRILHSKINFLCDILSKDVDLLREIEQFVNEGSQLSLIFDRQKCIRFINNIRVGKYSTVSAAIDAELIGVLATATYCNKYIVKC